jgi:hypothetical protein
MKSSMKNLTIAVTSIFYLSSAWCGLFGPSSYDECVLDKMKGQLASMRLHAENVCEISFPKEKLLDTNIWSGYAKEPNFSDIKYEYKITTNQLIDIIMENESNYKVTKIRLVTKDSCKKDSLSLDVVDVTAPIMGNTFTAKVNDSRKIQCVEVKFFGKRYK